MTLALDDVTDLDCVLSTDPLTLDLPETERYVTGHQAIAQRVLGGWAADANLLELEGSWDPTEIAILRSLLASIAEAEDYVRSIDVVVTLVDAGTLTIEAAIVFVDGTTYTFEVTAAEAVSVNFS